MVVAATAVVTAPVWLTAVLLTVDGFTDSAAPSDVVVVLGNEVLASGEPSDRLAARLDAAVMARDAGLVEQVIVSGGVGRSGHDEADAMARYLQAAGVPADDIIVDGLGVNTRATARNAAEIMDDRGWDSAIVATQFFHISRTALAFEQAGIDEVTTVHAQYREPRDAFALAREVPAWWFYRLGLR